LIKVVYPKGAAPLDSDETGALVPSHITTQAELNQWEQVNIQEAIKWLISRRRNPLVQSFMKGLHKKMFDKTWLWAGKYRTSNTNIGVDWPSIVMEVGNLLDDVTYQIDNQSYSIDEIAYRFHHRLVKIHPFPNGNGRHGRVACDYLLTFYNHQPFTWGNGNLTASTKARENYIKALRDADKGDYQSLSMFVRS
jgi:Fic-DOC domain mobile mystery protein B